MSKEIYISSTPHETRLAIVENDELTEIYYERENEYTLAGSIYNGRVTRVLPGMQSAFVDLGLERDAFLYITDFLEEAGESADFEGEGRSRGGERGRGSDERERSGVTLEGERVAAEPAAAAGEGEPSRERGRERDRSRADGRSGRGARDTRGGRGRGRGGEESRYGRPATTVPELPPPAFAEPGNLVPEEEEPLRSPVLEGNGEAGELGEGEPGAEGSRRWRGRRGRRRGRSGREMQGPMAAAESGGSGAQAQEDLAPTPDLSSGYDLDEADLERQEAFGGRLRASEEEGAGQPYGPAEGDFTAETTALSGETRSAFGEEGGYGAGGRTDRGERDAGFGREARPEAEGLFGQEPGREERGDRERRSARGERRGGERADNRDGREGRGERERRRELVRPRGFSPRGTPFAANLGDESMEGGAAPEPIQLPGESLARFGGGRSGDEPGRGARPEQGAAAPAESSAEFQLPGSWDGGLVLPGETLRPRTPAAGEEDRRPERSGDRERPSGRGGERRRDGRSGDGRSGGVRTEGRRDGGRGGDSRRGGSDRGRSGAGREGSDRGGRSRSESDRRPRPESGYEPQEGASATHRVDPDAPREFRLPAGFGDGDEGPGASHGETFGSNLTETEGAHTITPLVVTPLATGAVLDGVADRERERMSAETEGATGHEVTSISAGGEMLSPTPELPPAAEVEDPTAPIEHETAVREHHDAAEQSEPVAGEGLLEQEEFAPEGDDDGEEAEDFHSMTLHAASIEEMDYDDEAVETSADLGSMIRDMSIDEITHAEAAADEGDDDDEFAFEEEESLDDPEYQAKEQRQEPVIPAFTGASSEADEASYEAAGDQPVSPGGGTEEDRGRERGGRRDGRRSGGRDRDRSGRSGSGERDRFRAGRGREGHRSAQTTNLPAISDLLKPGQELLVQIAKEPIAKKGARITSHIALPGRFLVFMPTVNHTGVSRKIESDHERRRLKDILLSEKGEATGGFIVRTAASGATEEELRNDLRFLLNLWADIKQRSDGSKSPALIYHDLNLVERILRDQVTDNFSAIWVDSEADYERILRFLQRFQPSLIRRVKLYTKETPLFEQFGISEEINKALRSKVWLKSGGSIVINQTEALVAIDINTGKYVGKTARLEDTIVKTNLDAIPEIVRQIRLRDLGGIIIIDFIDMDERRNRNRVMAALEEELKKDRAPSKVLQFNDFGLVAITRKRVKQSLERTLSTPCSVCTGTGMVKSPVTVCNDIYVEMRKMQKHLDRGDVLLRVNPEVVKQLKSPNARWLQEMEEMVGKTILVKSDPTLPPEQFDIH